MSATAEYETIAGAVGMTGPQKIKSKIDTIFEVSKYEKETAERCYNSIVPQSLFYCHIILVNSCPDSYILIFISPADDYFYLT